jgi:pyruvate/2-oxoglutarate dehydrogenase complex dihydrolipoamide dehydrogenase (E3) component
VERYDVIVVGGGAAGLVTAAGSAGIGARPALIERERLGGECLWNGCIPSKALLAAAKAAAHARSAGRFGVHAEVRVDFAEAVRWVHGARDAIAPHDSPERFRGLGVEVVQGTARFVAPRTLAVEGRTLTAKRVVIATGSRPAIPKLAGLEGVPYFTNETIFESTDQPGHLLVLGGGPIGLELAQAFVRLGSRVTVVAASPTVLPREDDELAALLAARLAADGITILTSAMAMAVRRTTDGVALAIDGAGNGAAREIQREIQGTHLLVATGREARTETLDLGAGHVVIGDHGIEVDEHLRTSAEGVWACGDCIGGPRFTHVADYQARLVIRNAFFPVKGKVDYRAVPWVTYTDPELAHVGLTEREARDRHGTAVRVFRRPFDDVDRAIADGETQGMVKLITRKNGELLGGHVLGAGAGQMIGEITLALKHKLGVNALASLVHPYPTTPEAIKQAAEGFNKARFAGAPRMIAGWLARR